MNPEGGARTAPRAPRLLTPPILLATLASSLMNILSSPTKFRPSPTCYCHIRQLRCIRPYLDSTTAAPSFTPNSISAILSTSTNLPKSQITRLQQVQNSLARAVVKAPKSCHITSILRSLHAENNGMHRIQTYLTHLQSSHNHPSSMSA